MSVVCIYVVQISVHNTSLKVKIDSTENSYLITRAKYIKFIEYKDHNHHHRQYYY